MRRWDAEWSLFVIALWNVCSSQWLRSVPPLVQGCDRCHLLIGRIPDYSIYARCVLALIFRHSLDCQHFGTMRAGQQSLQGFHLAPSAFLMEKSKRTRMIYLNNGLKPIVRSLIDFSMSCLHNTRLQPTHVFMGGLPVDAVPTSHFLVRDRTSSCVYCHLLCLLYRFLKLSCDKRPDGSLPAFAWDDVGCCRNPYPAHYRLAFAFSIFLYPQRRRFTLRLPTPKGTLRAYRVHSE